MLPKLNSAHGSETRNIINRAIEVLNQHGKTIQDLVAEGQLTEEQYAELITTINGLVKSGQVDKLDRKISQIVSGSPKGTFETLTDLENAYPDGDTGVYVVIEDGKWYYWNEEKWRSGGLYQSSGLDAVTKRRVDSVPDISSYLIGSRDERELKREFELTNEDWVLDNAYFSYEEDAWRLRVSELSYGWMYRNIKKMKFTVLTTTGHPHLIIGRTDETASGLAFTAGSQGIMREFKKGTVYASANVTFKNIDDSIQGAVTGDEIIAEIIDDRIVLKIKRVGSSLFEDFIDYQINTPNAKGFNEHKCLGFINETDGGRAWAGYQNIQINDLPFDNLTDVLTNSVGTDALSYGVVGDGIADDTEKINAYLSYVSQNGEGIAFFPSGAYKITGTIYIPSDVLVYGVGDLSEFVLGNDYELDSTPWRTDYSYPYIRTETGAKNVIVRDLKITGNKSVFEDKRHYGLAFVDSENCLAENVTIEYINYNPELANSYGSMAYCLGVLRSTNITVRGGNLRYGGYENLGAEFADNLLIDGVNFGIGWRTSLQIHRGCKNVRIVNNHIEQNHSQAHAALTLHGHGQDDLHLRNIVIANNTINSITDSNFPNSGGIQFVSANDENVIVANNTVNSTNNALTLVRGNGFIVSDNHFKSNNDAINILGGRKYKITNNVVISGTSAYGVKLQSMSSGNAYEDIHISGNDIFGSGNLSRGISVENTLVELVIKDNKMIAAGGIFLTNNNTPLVVIDGNIINCDVRQAVYINHSNSDNPIQRGWSITRNVISTPDTAIDINAYLLRLVLSGNIIMSASKGIRLSRGVDYAMITNNDLSGATIKTEVLSGENHIIEHNLD